MADVWGSNTPPSMAKPRESTETDEVDMDGFVFTPTGLQVNLTLVEREEIVASAYMPPGSRGESDG